MSIYGIYGLSYRGGSRPHGEIYNGPCDMGSTETGRESGTCYMQGGSRVTKLRNTRLRFKDRIYKRK